MAVNVNKLYIESLVMQTDLCFCSPTGYRDAFLSWQNDRWRDYMWQLRGSKLTNMFPTGWNHQLVTMYVGKR